MDNHQELQNIDESGGRLQLSLLNHSKAKSGPLLDAVLYHRSAE
jgi:hypothetical protein